MRQIGFYRVFGVGSGTNVDINISNIFGNSTWMITYVGANSNGEFQNIESIEYYGSPNPDVAPQTTDSGLIFKDDGSGTFEFVKEEINKVDSQYFITNAITNGAITHLLPVPPITILRVSFGASVSISSVNLSLSGG